jgi:hypothetical protein
MVSSQSRTLDTEMERLKDLSEKSLLAHIFDYEAYMNMLQEILQHINVATTYFQVHTLISILGYIC